MDQFNRNKLKNVFFNTWFYKQKRQNHVLKTAGPDHVLKPLGTFKDQRMVTQRKWEISIMKTESTCRSDGWLSDKTFVRVA